ncbi:MAG: L,D-transpeptidase family protein [Clostridium sp.]|uniref:L,D-transpeptidase family protein n=1 Tax=Clostridium sp. TaxID=1506 RepID=UPI0025BE7F3C|nr:L,D-transpeptidase family protein [Clostridium sp.]MCH3963075.1 L,D-transpeptidase family protein [Clostridium sp.]MCI1716462.1 L,D-transpeptidase family protein [Clostridium sp.]MCI1800802.1 L,D-transpeptidase family protein [Clostridium sp.]MCI1814543.1 L,D-transpeptidase family protein [Clostridium sp.]MCI1871453.1 L,D-transpeptidase family protein [Clostridium sp.]
MKKRDGVYPFLFLVFGIILITLISGLSIKSYVRNSQDKSKVSVNSNNQYNNKIFFIKPAYDPKDTSVKIFKEKRILELYGDNKLVGRFKISLGRQVSGAKEREGDNRTPEGSYYVCYINANSKYKYFFGISYPNIEDAQNGLNKNVIDEITYNKIKMAIDEGRTPPWHTPLGGEIGIHGGGTQSDWTYGCIAMSDKDIDIVKDYIKLKTEIYIYR